jgi:uncharacterized membrane protein
MATPTTRRRRRLPYPLRVIAAHPRLAISVLFGIVVTAALHGWGNWPLVREMLVGWDFGLALYLVLIYDLMLRSDAEHIPEHAARADEGRIAMLVLTVLAASASIGVIVAELGVGSNTQRTTTQLALAGITIVLSWLFIHTIFALHYAHDYYGEHGGKRSGLDFPDEKRPDYWDFVYFSFVIGMTSQVSDVRVTSKLVRRTVGAHGIVSFFFNVALLALMVNIAAGAIAEKSGTPAS